MQNYCKKYNWIKIHKRSKDLSGDHSLQRLINIIPKICSGNHILWTHVTSPLFTSKDYMSFLNIFFKQKQGKFSSAFSADAIQKFIFSSNKGWVSHNINKIKWPRSQDLKGVCSLTFVINILNRKDMVNWGSCVGSSPYFYCMDKIDAWDIDDQTDFDFCEFIYNKRFIK